MHIASLLLLLMQADDQVFNRPNYFTPVFLVLLAGGGAGWLVAAVLGFSRARAFGAPARWFALAAVCLIIYHLQILLLGFGVAFRDNDLVLSIGAFLNLFIVLGSVCAIVGLVRLADPPR